MIKKAIIIILAAIIVALGIFIEESPPKSGFTELYFIDPLPKNLSVGNNFFYFGINNMENNDKTYSYKVYAEKILIGNGTVQLKKRQPGLFKQEFRLYEKKKEPIKFSVILDGQEIHFWGKIDD